MSYHLKIVEIHPMFTKLINAQKSHHGTFRPKLLQLVQSNAPEIIEETTREAFSILETGSSAALALNKLVELKGIGPATASLLLSVYDPDTTPFFSDEVFRWTHWSAEGSPGGWKRKIKYNSKEYLEVVSRVERLVKRLGVRAVDVERVAWVLGKEEVDVDGEDEGEVDVHDEDEDEATKGDKGEVESKDEDGKTEVEEIEDPEESKQAPKPKKGVKRKAGNTKPPAEGLRRSSRRKLDG
jgi:hypothetical protein